LIGVCFSVAAAFEIAGIGSLRPANLAISFVDPFAASERDDWKVTAHIPIWKVTAHIPIKNQNEAASAVGPTST
jgi:hypothetical protein